MRPASSLGLIRFLRFRPRAGLALILINALVPSLAAAPFAAALIGPQQAEAGFLERLRAAYGIRAVVLNLELAPTNAAATARTVTNLGFTLHYWFEVARQPALAEARPAWMSSLQGHQEWRRFYPELPALKSNEVVKNYPWVPIFYEENFAAHRDRIRERLRELPAARSIFLNGLQGGPSACGCGHPLCRWTSDYGPIQTATPRPGPVAADFVSALAKLALGSTIIPVWTTECEEHDKPGLCADVGCFEGTCWKAFSAQLQPLAERVEQLAVLAPYKAFQRDLPRYGEKAGWVRHALESFRDMPPRRGGRAVSTDRLAAVLQAWDVTQEEILAQIAQTRLAGAGGYVLAFTPLDQSWEPRIIKTR